MTKAWNLRTRLLLWVSSPLIALWIASSWIDHDIATGFVNLTYDRALLDTALDLGRNVREVNNKLSIDLPTTVIDMLVSGEEGQRLFYRANSPSGDLIAGDSDLPKPPKSAQTERITYYNSTYHGAPIRAVAVRSPVQPGTGKGSVLIEIAEHTEGRNSYAQQIMLRMIIPQGILVILAILSIWFGVGLALQRLQVIQNDIEQRSHIDLSPIERDSVPSEIQPLIDAMNGLLSRLNAALSLQHQFIADAAHQLRTPVAAIKAQTELAQRQAQSPEVLATLNYLVNAADHAGHLVNQLLTMARAQPGANRHIQLESVDLVQVTRNVTEDWVPQAIQRNIDLGFDQLSENLTLIMADPDLIRELLSNLIDNAVHYTPDNGRITVRVYQSLNEIALEVEDSGPGIPEQERLQVFQRFYRVPGTNSNGCGLGLAIVHEIASSHHARVSIDDGPQGIGATLRVYFKQTTSI